MSCLDIHKQSTSVHYILIHLKYHMNDILHRFFVSLWTIMRQPTIICISLFIWLSKILPEQPIKLCFSLFQSFSSPKSQILPHSPTNQFLMSKNLMVRFSTTMILLLGTSFCLSYFLIALIKILWKKQLAGEKFHFVFWCLEVTVPHDRKGMVADRKGIEARTWIWPGYKALRSLPSNWLFPVRPHLPKVP